MPLFCWAIWKKEKKIYVFAAVLLSLTLYYVQDVRQPAGTAPSHGEYTGRLVFKANFTIDGDSLRGLAELADGSAVYASYRFFSSDEKKFYENRIHKSELMVKGVFELPSPPAHRFAFNMPAYLKENGASRQLEITEIRSVTGRTDLAARLAVRRHALKHHIRNHFPEGLAAEAEALLIGERSGMTTEDEQLFRRLGITHLYAISGLHVGIATGLVYFSLIRFRFRKETVQLLLLAALPLYAMLAGGAPSVFRAVSMTSAVLLLRLLGVKTDLPQILLLSFSCFILIDPYSMYQIGFQLSYGASFAIACSLRFLERSGSVWKAGLFITAVTQLMLYPLLLFYFYEVSLSALFVNSIFVPLYTILIVPMNFMLLFMTWLSPVAADFLFGVYEPFRSAIASGMNLLAAVPYQVWNPGKPDAAIAALLTVSSIWFLSEAEKVFKWRQLLIIFIPAAVFTCAPYIDPSLKVSFIDVGQGDSMLIELPYKKAVYLIDTGGLLRFEQKKFQERSRPYEVGRQVVAPYLKGKGISAIDVLIVSHPDADHMEGLDELLTLFRIGQLHITPGTQKEKLMEKIMTLPGIPEIREPARGFAWQESGTWFTYLSPADNVYEGNNDSLVLLMKNGSFSALFTGDLEQQGEEELVRLYNEQLKGGTILKVAHHGSKSSSSEGFLELARPALSIVSSGKGNRYGHPDPEVLNRFAELGLPFLNTAESGTVEVIYRRGRISVTTSR